MIMVEHALKRLVLTTISGILLKNPYILYRFTIESDFCKNDRSKPF
ncbi:hypothetical protein SAMN04487995_2748 [Dyadobacter koreensis]|uniref:Uncharacterized protein n=1 Tax=Dyadobacter koreensis TaxID=408657 RepID=A0A1H6UWD9_9BACT|nr:hypothetical protein SAMN04487995_2748 [Dyadobacter koreensis]